MHFGALSGIYSSLTVTYFEIWLNVGFAVFKIYKVITIRTILVQIVFLVFVANTIQGLRVRAGIL